MCLLKFSRFCALYTLVFVGNTSWQCENTSYLEKAGLSITFVELNGFQYHQAD